MCATLHSLLVTRYGVSRRGFFIYAQKGTFTGQNSDVSIGPHMRLHCCGLPALRLFVIKRIYLYAHTVFIEKRP